jgi:hypothetical protein
LPGSNPATALPRPAEGLASGSAWRRMVRGALAGWRFSARFRALSRRQSRVASRGPKGGMSGSPTRALHGKNPSAAARFGLCCATFSTPPASHHSLNFAEASRSP